MIKQSEILLAGKKIGFIGAGVMGKSMILNLMKKGFEVDVYARDKEKIQDILKEGVKFCETINSCVKDKDVVMTIVAYPKDVKDVYLSKDGILDSATKGTYLIDMTTTSPSLTTDIYNIAKERDLKFLDAPVSGGDIGAKNATLSVMIGGNEEDFNSCKDIFKALGTTVIYTGISGSGQHTKMANQIAIAGIMAGISEAMAYGKDKGLDIETMLKSISTGSASSWHMSNNAPKMLKKDFKAGFYIKHMVKDLTIASSEAPKLKVLKDVLEMYETLEENGDGDLGTQAICKYYE